MDKKEFRKLLQETLADAGILRLVDPQGLREITQLDKDIDDLVDKMVSKLFPLIGGKVTK